MNVGRLLLISLALLVTAVSATKPYWQESMRSNAWGLDNAMRSRCGGPRGHRCIEDASCVRGRCVCQRPYRWGAGDFACYEQGTYAAEIKNDPSFRTFAGETYLFPYPCRYKISHLQSFLKTSRGQKVGYCDFQLHGFNAKKRGKLFAFGFDAAITMHYFNGMKVRRSTRNFGILKGIIPIIYSQTTKNRHWPDGPFLNDRFSFWDAGRGIRLTLRAVRRDRRIVLEAPNCGIKVTFVPYDVVNRLNCRRVPGISLSVQPGFHTLFYDRTDTMALAPQWGAPGYLSAYRINPLDDTHSMLYRAFTRNVQQNSPWGARSQCMAIRPSLDRCSSHRDRKWAIRNCFWMLEEPRFMRCYDNQFNSAKLLELVNKCIHVYCGHAPCSSIQDMVKNSRCDSVPRITRLSKLITGESCP